MVVPEDPTTPCCPCNSASHTQLVHGSVDPDEMAIHAYAMGLAVKVTPQRSDTLLTYSGDQETIDYWFTPTETRVEISEIPDWMIEQNKFTSGHWISIDSITKISSGVYAVRYRGSKAGMSQQFDDHAVVKGGRYAETMEEIYGPDWFRVEIQCDRCDDLDPAERFQEYVEGVTSQIEKKIREES